MTATILQHRPGTESVVLYRPCSPLARILFSLLFVGAIGGFAGMALFMTRTVRVDGSHGDSMLVITKTYPLFGARRELHDLASIQGTGLRSRVAKNGAVVYAVTLRTAGGEETITANYAAWGRQGQRRALDAFLAHPDAPPLHLLYDRGNPWGALFCIIPAIWLWVLWTLWQEATVRFEWWRNAVVLERRRWPLAPWSRALQLGELTGARVDERGVGRRKTFRVVLLLGSGEALPLLTFWASGGPQAGAAAAGINAALARPDSREGQGTGSISTSFRPVADAPPGRFPGR